jgi:hypothetical protein
MVAPTEFGLRRAAVLRAAMMIRPTVARSAALRLLGGSRWSPCQATSWASFGRTAPRGIGSSRNPTGPVSRAPVGGRSGPGFGGSRLQARRMMISELVVLSAALGLRAVAPSAHTRCLLGKTGSCRTMADGRIEF